MSTPRSKDQIISDYQTSVHLSDDSADASKGPLYSLVAVPLADVLTTTEQDVVDLEQIYSVDFAKTATDAQSLAFLNNWGESAGTGSPSTTRVFFMSFSRPAADQTITIPQGTLVSNQDKSLQFITTEAASIVGNVADSFYNSQRRSYEVAVPVEAVVNDPAYDLPALRILTLVTQLTGIDAVENREAASGGISAETNQSQVERMQEKFLGLAVNTPDGEITRIKRINPSLIRDVKVITQNDRQNFKRLSYNPALDYYILGTQLETVSETYTVPNPVNYLVPIQHVPAVSISSITVNGVSLSLSPVLVQDDSLEYGYSTRAQDKIDFTGTGLLAGDVIIFSVTYNKLLTTIQSQALSDTKLYETDELARNFRNVPISVELTGRVLSSFDPEDVKTNLLTNLQSIIAPGAWRGEFQPYDVLQQLKTEVAGIASLSMIQFHRVIGGTSDLETVVIQDNELAKYDQAHIIINIRTT